MYLTTSYDNDEVMPMELRNKYHFLESNSAAAIIQAVSPDEWNDILSVLDEFVLDPPEWMHPGGNRGNIAKEIDGMFEDRGWSERRLDIETTGYLVDRKGEKLHTFPPLYQEGYLVDNFKGRVALDVEWNAKDGNLDRDMTAYRTWHEAGVLTAGIIITKHRGELKQLATQLWREWHTDLEPDAKLPKLPIDVGTTTTTNFEKAALRIRRGVMGTCPMLIIGVGKDTWNGKPYQRLALA